MRGVTHKQVLALRDIELKHVYYYTCIDCKAGFDFGAPIEVYLPKLKLCLVCLEKNLIELWSQKSCFPTVPDPAFKARLMRSLLTSMSNTTWTVDKDGDPVCTTEDDLV